MLSLQLECFDDDTDILRSKNIFRDQNSIVIVIARFKQLVFYTYVVLNLK